MAGSGIARIGDITIGKGTHHLKGCPHVITGVIITGSPITSVDGLGVARVGDLTSHNCPHCSVGILLTGSPITTADGIPVSRFGDAVNETCGSGIIITASPISFSI
jgi:uncharacterized Zn-binding protein involved in type VI secretion